LACLISNTSGVEAELRLPKHLADFGGAPMASCRVSRTFCFSLAILIAIAFFCPSVVAQGPLPDAPLPASPPAIVQPASASVFEAPTPSVKEHRFWDRKNSILFTISAAFSGVDFAVTRSNLQSGGHELNPVVRAMGTSTPALAANFVGENMGMIGLSYYLHRMGHHKLERAVSLVNISASAGAVSFGLAHR
jgi:hypothetical protein